MIRDEGRLTTDDRPLPVVHRPSSVVEWPVWLALCALAAALVICAGGGWLASRQIDLFHAAYFESCSMRAYQFHWQDARRVTDTFRYDFIMSPDSFVLVEAWVQNGKILEFSQNLPTNCRA